MAPGKKGKNVAVESSKQPPAHVSTQSPHVLEEPPPPIAKLDFSDVGSFPRNYETFIKAIREAVTSSDVGFDFTFEGEQAKNRRIPMTPDEDQTPTGFCSFELTDGNVRLLIVCEKYQFWLRGIVTNDGTPFEIDLEEDEEKETKPKVMAGSESLNTTAIYPKLLGGNSVDRCRIGYQSFLAAFYRLAGHSKNSSASIKTALAVLLVMIFEAVRIIELYNLSLELLTHRRDQEVGAENKALINGWSDNCRDFYKENRDTEKVQISGSTGTATKKVADSIYMLCRSPFNRWLENKPNETKGNSRKVEAGSSSSKK